MSKYPSRALLRLQRALSVSGASITVLWTASLASTVLVALVCFVSLVPTAAVATDWQVRLRPSGLPAVDAALSDGSNLPALALSRLDTEPQLLDAAGKEAVRLSALLRDLGYLKGRVEVEVAGDGVDLVPVPGAAFVLGSIELAGMNGVEERLLAGLRDRSLLSLGLPASLPNLIALQDDVLWRLRGSAFAEARIAGHELVPDAATETASLRLQIDPGPLVHLGEIEARGLASNDVSGLSLPVGAPYTPEIVADIERQLALDPDIESVRVQLGETDASTGLTPLEVTARKATDSSSLAANWSAGVAVLVLLSLVLLARTAIASTTIAPRHHWRLSLDATAAVLAMVALPLLAERFGIFLAPR